MRWTKAAPWLGHPINHRSHLGTCVTGASNRAGAATPWSRLLHTSDGIRSDERPASSRRIRHSVPKGPAGAAQMCRTHCDGDLLGHALCRFPEAGIPPPVLDAESPCGCGTWVLPVVGEASDPATVCGSGRRLSAPDAPSDTASHPPSGLPAGHGVDRRPRVRGTRERSPPPSLRRPVRAPLTSEEAERAGPSRGPGCRGPAGAPGERNPWKGSCRFRWSSSRYGRQLPGSRGRARVMADSAFRKGSWQSRLNAPGAACVPMANQAPLYGCTELPHRQSDPVPPGGRVF